MRAVFPVNIYVTTPFRQGSSFLRRIYICILQYVIIKPVVAIVAMLLFKFGLYTEGSLTFVDGSS